MKTLLLSLQLLAFLLAFGTASADDIIVTDDGSGTGTVTWTSDNTYILDGFVFVNSGQVLTIEAGTVIKGMSGTGADASALIVARGGQIFAEGMATDPIIFTFEGDPMDGSIPYDTRGQWGGLIVLGEAGLNSEPGETQIEGIPETESRGLYGGNDDMDDSGIIRYVSVRHGGSDIGAGNEINGITLGGVGSETIIEYVEVISNADDGIEFFGGTAQVKYACVAFGGDDSFDYDEGWRGKGQFWFTIHDDSGDGQGDRGGEHDGGTDPEEGSPFATPTIYNATYMGRGIAAGRRALTFRDNAGGTYTNSIFFNWGRGVDIENLPSGEDSYQRFLDGELSISGNCFWNTAAQGNDATAEDIFKVSLGAGWETEADSIAALDASTLVFQTAFEVEGNEVANPGLTYDISEGSESLIVEPTNAVNAIPPTDDWFTDAEFKGAFDPSADCTWLHGWSFLDERLFLGCVTAVEQIEDVAKGQLELYPNPNNGTFTVVVPTVQEQAVLSVHDMFGRVVAQKSLNANATNVTVNFEGLSKGTYIVSLQGETYRETTRMTIQ